MNIIHLYLNDNELSGEIPCEICNMSDFTPSLFNNQLCPPYPDCISQSDIDLQDTSECIESSELHGDLNSDGVINIQDIIVMVHFILNDNNNECSDINEDGLIDILDIINLLDIILGD